MKIQFDTNQYFKKLKNSKSYFQTFINKESLATGVIFLKSGQKDTQEPHESDEIYYILDGNGFLEINKKSYSIKKGQIYFVAKISPTISMEIQKIFQYYIFLAVLISRK